MNPSWAEIAQALAAVGGFTVAVVGFGVLIYQVKQVERAIRSDTVGRLYAHANEVMRLFADHSDLRPYFYEGKSPDAKAAHYGLVLTVSEMV